MGMNKYTKELLEPIVKQSKSFAELLRNLGIKQSGGSQQYIKSKCILFGVDTSHFIGQSWARGITQQRHLGRTDEKLFSLNTAFHTSLYRNRLIKSGRPYVCEICNSKPVWCNKPLTLHVDHKNGNRTDNRKINLRFLCPNCHQQTETWGSKIK